jgi:hypothetical protein
MKVLISKYELRSIEERWPDFEQCPDFVEVATVPLSVFNMTPKQRTKLKKGIVRKTASKSERRLAALQ